MRRLFLILILMTLLHEANHAQNLMYKAQIHERDFRFREAIDYYQKALIKARKQNDVQLYDIYFRLGNCYRLVNDYEQARMHYLKSIQSGSVQPENYFRIGDALLGLCRYDEAIESFKKVRLYASDSKLLSLTEYRIEMAEKAMRNENLNPNIQLVNMRLFNTEYSEFGVYYKNYKLFYSSMRKDNYGSKTDRRTLQGFSNIFMSANNLIGEQPSGSTRKVSGNVFLSAWSKPAELGSPFNTKEYNDGTLAIDFGENVAYVMQCKGKNGGCHIVSVRFNENFLGRNSSKINLSSDEFSIGHPSLSTDGKTMYFVSDMPGGFGGTDIWKTTKTEGGVWSNPVNLGGNINTPFDEMFPSLYMDSLIVFSSSGHKGYGGLDLYYSHLQQDESFGKPVNFGLPLNSGADDFSLIYSKDLNGGFFCSNRPGGVGSDDIYYYSGLPFRIQVQGFVCDKNTRNPVEDAVVIVSLRNELSDTLYSDKNGFFNYKITPGKHYVFDVYKHEYSQNLQTVKIEETDLDHIFRYAEGENMELLFELYPNKTGIAIQGTVTENRTSKPVVGQQMILVDPKGYFDQTVTDDKGVYYFGDLVDNTTYIIMLASKGYWTRKKVIEVPKLSRPMTFSSALSYDMDFEAVEVQTNKEIVLYDIYYEFDKASLLDSSRIELDKIVVLLKENPNLTVELSSHTDERGNDTYNMNLSQRRAQSVVDYLVSRRVSKRNLVAKGYGKTQPIVRNAKTEHDHQLNRRTAFKVLHISDQNIELIVESVAPQLPQLLEGDLKYSNVTAQNNAIATIATEHSSIVYKVQILALYAQIQDDSYFRKALSQISDLSIIEEYDEKENMYRYYAGTFSSMKDAVRLKNRLRGIGYDSFIKVFKNSGYIQ
jgi:outer membrane protein OmpA-like peptidoglycan-associated protein